MLRLLARYGVCCLLSSALIVTAAGAASAADAILTDDAYVSSGSPNGNFGGAVTIRVSATERSLIRFDLASTLPPGTTGSQVAKATLKLFAATGGTFSPGPFDVAQVADPWSEEVVTHNLFPALGAAAGQGQVVATRSFVAVDLTALVQSWVDGGQNHGIALIRSPGSGLTARFDSKESTGTGHEPRLEITLGAAVQDVSVRARSTMIVSIPTHSGGPLSLDAEVWDTGCPEPGMHNPAANPGRLTACVTGKYYIFGQVEWSEPNVNGARHIQIDLVRPDETRTTIANVIKDPPQPANQVPQQISTHYLLSAGESVELVVQQTSGETLDLLPSDYSPVFGMVKLP